MWAELIWTALLPHIASARLIHAFPGRGLHAPQRVDAWRLAKSSN